MACWADGGRSTVADFFVEYFVTVSRKDPIVQEARHYQNQKAHGVAFIFPRGQSYNVPFSTPELKMAVF